MYIGGMAGTGKSEVIKALTAFFEKWNESPRIVIQLLLVLQLL